MKSKGFTPLRIIIHLGAWLPLIWIAGLYFTGGLSVNPIQDVEQRTGRLAILWLVLSLTCSPLASIFGWKELIKRRRTLGLYAFMFASMHMFTFIWLDYGLNFTLIKDAIAEKKFILIGVTSWSLLSLLAITSFTYWKKKLGKNWKRLHRAVYVIAPLVVVHYALAKKGDLLRLQGDIVKPAIYGLVVLVLLILRISPVKAFITARWSRLKKGFATLTQRSPQASS